MVVSHVQRCKCDAKYVKEVMPNEQKDHAAWTRTHYSNSGPVQMERSLLKSIPGEFTLNLLPTSEIILKK